MLVDSQRYKVTSNANVTLLDFATSKAVTLDITNDSTFIASNGTGANAIAGVVNVEAGSDLEIGGTLNFSGRFGRIYSFGTTDITATINSTGGTAVLASDTGGTLNISDSTVTQSAASQIRAGAVPFGGGTTNLTDDTITGGLVVVRSSAGVLNLDGVTINSALLDTQYGGSMEVVGDGAVFNNIENTGYVNVNDGRTLTLQGTINNKTYQDGIPPHHTPATLFLDSVGNGGKKTTLVIDGAVTLTGGGQVVLSDNSRNLIDFDQTGTLDNIDNLIEGAGKIGQDEGETGG